MFYFTGVSCDPIDIPTNGNYELSNQRYHGSVATFSCGTGFTLEGNTSQYCVVEPGAGGVWQGTAPTCKRKYNLCVGFLLM